MSEISIPQGETKEIIPSDQANTVYLLEVVGATVRIGHNERYAREGSRIKSGDRVKINPFGKRLFAHAEDADARLILDHANSDIEYQSRADIADISRIEVVNEIDSIPTVEAELQAANGTLQDSVSETQTTNSELEQLNDSVVQTQTRSVSELQNHDTITSFSVSPDQSMPSNAVPDGVTVVLQADPNNVDPVLIGQIKLSAGSVMTLAVSNTDAIDTSGSSGDSLNVLFEGGS